MIGDQKAMIGNCFPIGNNPLDGVQGSIFRFTEIDLDSPWLNTLTGKEISPDEVHDLVAVPESLKPNFSLVWYNFFPRTHKLVFELERNDPVTKKRSTFGAETARKFFQRVFANAKISAQYQQIEVTIVQKTDTLREIFSMPVLRKLDIVINRPNPTDGTFEEMIEQQLESERASKFAQHMESKDKKGLAPSETTKALAEVALSNGHVEGHVTDPQGVRRKILTIKAPVQEVRMYDPEQGFGHAFTAAARQIAGSNVKS